MGYYFNYKLFFSVVYRSFFANDKLETRLTLKRFIFLIIAIPLFALTQIINFICFLIDDIVFASYKKIAVKTPLFIIGVPRSGTTFMHRLFSKDEQFTSIKTWEMIYAPTITQKLFYCTLGKLDALIGSPAKKLIIAFEKKALADFNKIHKVGMFEAEEDEFMLLFSFTSSYSFFFFPDMRIIDMYDWYDEVLSEKERHKIMNYRKALIQKHLYVFGKDKTYIAKNPGDCPKVVTMIEVFPDARMIYLVRNPFETIPSLMNLMNSLYLVANSAPEQDMMVNLIERIFLYWYEYVPKALEQVPESQQMTIMYQDLVDTPKVISEAAYNTLGYEISDAFNEVLISETEKAKGYTSKHSYDISSLGISYEYILETYQHIFEKYNLDKSIS